MGFTEINWFFPLAVIFIMMALIILALLRKSIRTLLLMGGICLLVLSLIYLSQSSSKARLYPSLLGTYLKSDGNRYIFMKGGNVYLESDGQPRKLLGRVECDRPLKKPGCFLRSEKSDTIRTITFTHDGDIVLNYLGLTDTMKLED